MALDALTGSVIGIEVDHYLRKLVQQSRSPLFTPWSGVAQALIRLVSFDLSVLKSLEIKPIFIFTGLQVVSQHEKDSSARLLARTQALTNLERKRNDETMQSFSSLTAPTDMASALKQYLRAEGIEFLVAPYFAAAQLNYMLRAGLIDSIYGAPDTLVHGAERVITDISFSPQLNRVTFCDKASILAFLQGITDEQFLDAYLFAGNEFCPIVPILEPNPPSEYSAYRMRAAADVVRQNGTGYLALNGNPMLEKRPRYLEEWLRARALFRHHPYLNTDGDVVLARDDKAPSDVARVIGARLPRELYFYISRGVLEPHLINALLSGVWRENVPLDGGETREYRSLLDGLNEIRVQCMNLLHGSKQLHHYYEKKPVITNMWFQDQRNTEDTIERLDFPLYDSLKGWRVNATFFEQHAEPGARDLRSLLSILEKPEAVTASITKDTGSKTAIDSNEMSTNAMYRLLQLRGYIAQDHSLTDWGRALLGALETTDAKLYTAVLVAVEMLKLHTIKAEDFSARFLQKSTQDQNTPDADWKILGRIAAVLPLQQNDAPWQGPIDREALVSFSLSQTVTRYLATLYEMCQINMLLRGDVKRTETFSRDLSKASNPFSVSLATHDAGLCIYAKRWFGMLQSRFGSSTSQDTAIMFEQLKSAFPTSRNGKADIEALYALWKALYTAVQAVTQSKQMGSIEFKKFERTQEWLAARQQI